MNFGEASVENLPGHVFTTEMKFRALQPGDGTDTLFHMLHTTDAEFSSPGISTTTLYCHMLNAEEFKLPQTMTAPHNLYVRCSCIELMLNAICL